MGLICGWPSRTPPPSPSPLSGIPDQVTGYLTGLIPAGLIDTGIAAFFTAATLVLAALAHHHDRRQAWLCGWLSGPAAIFTALIAASYGTSGLPNLFGVDPFARDPRSFAVDAAVTLLVAALVAGAAWPVAAHVAAHRGSPITLAALRNWALAERLHAGGGAAAGAAGGWIVLGPLLCVAGAVIGALATAVVEHLRRPVTPVPPAEHLRPPAALPRAPVPPAVISDEDW